MDSKTFMVKDSTGKIIQEHDVVKDEAGTIYLVELGINSYGRDILGTSNKFIGAQDQLDVYPDGVLTIVGNVDFKGDED